MITEKASCNTSVAYEKRKLAGRKKPFYAGRRIWIFVFGPTTIIEA
jgi:hypothetical protein